MRTGDLRVGAFCTGGTPDPFSAETLEELHEYERLHVPKPTPKVQPAKATLVNLPVVVSVADVGPRVMNVNLPVPGQLVATPTYDWTFDDGATLTGAGVAYDGTDPRTDPEHYLAHTYFAAKKDAFVTLTVTWNATFTAAGSTVTLAPLVMEPVTTTYSVYEAHSVLVDGSTA